METGQGQSATRTKKYLMFDDGILPLTEAKDVFLGRDCKSCDIFFFDERVSRKHARVFCRNGRYYVQDLDSVNGIYVNGKKVHGAVELIDGDVVALRPHEVTFVDEEQLNHGVPEPQADEPEAEKVDDAVVPSITQEVDIEDDDDVPPTIAVRRERQHVIKIQPTAERREKTKKTTRSIKIIRKKR